MRIERYKIGYACLLLSIFITGCSGNSTFFYPDKENSGLGIFSNTGNNVFSCYVNGNPWRTQDRKWSSGVASSSHTYEINISKQYTDSPTTLLSIIWYRSYFDQISLFVSVPRNFSYADFATWQGKRLSIDGVNSYFTMQVDGYNNTGLGLGTIYFNKLNFDNMDSAFGNEVTGRMSGLLEVDFGSVKITSGRFDHNLDANVIHFW